MHGSGIDRTRSVATLLLLALLTAPACGEAPAAVESAPAVQATAVRLETLSDQRVLPSLRIPGLVEAKSRISLAFRVSGFVERFAVDEGDSVAAGDILAVLDPSDFRREARGARAALDRTLARARDAKQNFERQELLRERGTASEQAYDRALSAHEVARAEAVEAQMRLEHAEDRLAKATLRAPIKGTIERRLIEAHEPATAEHPVLILTELDSVTVRASVADRVVGGLRVGQVAWVRSPFAPDARVEGRVVRIGVAADPATRTVPFEIEIDNRERILLPELAVEVEIATGEEQAALLLPMSAVLRDADTRPFCFVAVERDGALHAERRVLTTGSVHGNRIAIRSGLRPGDRVVVRGQHFLRPGELLNPVGGG